MAQGSCSGYQTVSGSLPFDCCWQKRTHTLHTFSSYCFFSVHLGFHVVGFQSLARRNWEGKKEHDHLPPMKVAALPRADPRRSSSVHVVIWYSTALSSSLRGYHAPYGETDWMQEWTSHVLSCLSPSLFLTRYADSACKPAVKIIIRNCLQSEAYRLLMWS